MIPVRIVNGDRTCFQSVTQRGMCIWRTVFRSSKHEGASTRPPEGIASLGTLLLHDEYPMKAVSVTKLKSNPSAALRAAREHPVVVLDGQRPESVLGHLEKDPILDEPGIRLALAIALYREENI